MDTSQMWNSNQISGMEQDEETYHLEYCASSDNLMSLCNTYKAITQYALCIMHQPIK